MTVATSSRSALATRYCAIAQPVLLVGRGDRPDEDVDRAALVVRRARLWPLVTPPGAKPPTGSRPRPGRGRGGRARRGRPARRRSSRGTARRGRRRAGERGPVHARSAPAATRSGRRVDGRRDVGPGSHVRPWRPTGRQRGRRDRLGRGARAPRPAGHDAVGPTRHQSARAGVDQPPRPPPRPAPGRPRGRPRRATMATPARTGGEAPRAAGRRLRRPLARAGQRDRAIGGGAARRWSAKAPWRLLGTSRPRAAVGGRT